MAKNESSENYLEAILMLSKKLPVVRSVDIANELGFKKSSVSIAMKKLRQENHITVTDAGPKVGIVLQAGPALLFQEAGNMMTMLIALPLGLLLGLGRSAVGGTFSLCRDTALGIIGDEYGLESREGMGTLGTYISGSVFGTLFYSFLAPVGLAIGFHPYALAMASGMGSASMMNAATAALTNAAAPMYAEQILAYSATSGLLTAVTGVYVEMFLALPLANWYYNRVNPGIEKLRAKLFKKASEEA